MLGVAEGKAAVAARDQKGGTHLHLIDLAGGRITASLDSGKSAGRGIGFTDDGLLFTVDGLGGLDRSRGGETAAGFLPRIVRQTLGFPCR